MSLSTTDKKRLRSMIVYPGLEFVLAEIETILKDMAVEYSTQAMRYETRAIANQDVSIKIGKFRLSLNQNPNTNTTLR